MEFIISAIAFILIFTIIILIHEFGHFYVARKSGVKVEEFGFGLPPRIWGKKIKGTLYSLNWIPFGGFVRLYGENHDPKLFKDKKSFVGKPLRKRMAIIIAGVIMNFILAVVLLTIGFVGGIEPLIVNSDDVFMAIEDGTIEIEHGIRIKGVQEGSIAGLAGLQANDVINKVNGFPIVDIAQLDIFSNPPLSEGISVEIFRNGDIKELTLNPQAESEDLGLTIHDATFLPRVVIRDILPGSPSEQAGLQQGDVIIEMNSKPVYFVSEYQAIVSAENSIEYNVVRDFQTLTISVQFEETQRLVISEVLPDGDAIKAGFVKGDVILEINGEKIESREEALDITKKNAGKELLYKIDRNGEIIEFNVTPNREGLIGVYLDSLVNYQHNQLGLYNTNYLTSIIDIKKVSFPLPQAIGEAFNESGRLALLTVGMFGNLVRSITSQLAVPEGVAGPVGIARLTHVFVQDGLFALLRFTALLSLSLGVINIIPFPALDGGRLLFLLVEAVSGKRVPHKWEAAIHALGFAILIALIFFVTYTDIVRIFV